MTNWLINNLSHDRIEAEPVCIVDVVVPASLLPLLQRSLAIREKALGREHPDVAQSLNNLGALYPALGHYAEAEARYKRALAIREKTLGPEHPDVAQSLETYAGLLRETGRNNEATIVETRAKAIRAEHAQDNPIE